jgi:hypothetical protein
MPSRPEDSEPRSEDYEPPEVEELDTGGPISTAPDGTAYPSVTLIEEDDEERADEQARGSDG